MRSATVAANVGVLLASFALGLVVGRQERAPYPAQLERQPVAGSSPAAPSADSPPGASQEPDPAPAPTPAPQSAKEVLTWGQVAARAQSWTAAVRADQNYGAGVVLSGAGLVLTNLHVVDGTRSIAVTPFGVEPSVAEIVDTDAELDVALLRLQGVTPNAATLGSARELAVGDEVLAVGSPRKMYFSVSRGMVSFPNRFLDGVEYIQTDLPINVGNSGGPLVDREGRVIGIVSFILRDSQGISFALPIDRAVTRFAQHLQPAEAANAAEAAAGANAANAASRAGASKSGENKAAEERGR